MAAYPSIGLRHKIKPLTKRITDISDAGDIRSVDTGSDTVYRISLVHPIINDTDRATLIAFYVANKNNVNTITLAGDAYDTQFESDYEVDSISGTYFDVSVTLIGTKS
jgi:hypothetical protein